MTTTATTTTTTATTGTTATPGTMVPEPMALGPEAPPPTAIAVFESVAGYSAALDAVRRSGLPAHIRRLD